MRLFKRHPDDIQEGSSGSPSSGSSGAAAGGTSSFADQLRDLVSAANPSLGAHSDFVKHVSCASCGAPKRLGSKTAYLYCDHCGALVDYDFRMANLGTNAGVTNTVFHHLVGPVQAELDQAEVDGDQERYREVIAGVFREWMAQCPQAVSPRAQNDEQFRSRMVDYLAATTVSKEFDPRQAPLEAESNQAIASLERRPTGSGAWMVSEGIWQVAGVFKDSMEMAYERIGATGISALDPDDAPDGVPLRMEYSTFCQGWLPHLSTEDGEKLLALFGLSGEYQKVDVPDAVNKKCGGCGADLPTVPEATCVVCETCGRRLDISGGEVPCAGCGAPLTFPVDVSSLECPYCRAGTTRA